MKTNWMPLAAIIGAMALALTLSSCGGKGTGVTCVENMPGMIMCPQDEDQVAPVMKVAPKAQH